MMEKSSLIVYSVLSKDDEVELSPAMRPSAAALPWWVPTHQLTQLDQQHQDSASPGEKMSSDKGKEVIFTHPLSVKDRFEITLAQPMGSTNPGHPTQFYGLFTTYVPNQSMGPVMMPMSLATADGPVYVNPKQYHGILRRRESRAKAALKAKPRPINKPYRHESRHRHAMRRPRGAGGRFLNSKELEALKELERSNNNKNKVDNINNYYSSTSQRHNPCVSSNSEVLQNPNPTGSEVTSNFLLYGNRQFDHWFHSKNSFTTTNWDVPPPSDHACCDFLRV